MKKNIIALAAVIASLILFSGCGQRPSPTSDTASLLHREWEDVVREAKGQTVSVYMWGGSDSINRYIDEWAAPRLNDRFDIRLERVPVQDTKDIINRLLSEKQAGRDAGGMDVIWINGENFKEAKGNGLLWGAFAGNLPNVKRHVDLDAQDIRFDFGVDTKGLEAPWGKAQFIFIYDSEKIKRPPRSMEDLKAWVKKNPGTFTCPPPPDFTGSAFIRHVLFETTGGHEPYLKEMDEQTFRQKLEPMWAYLNEIEPYLWREGKTYPESLAKLDQLYRSGEVWMTMGYDAARASNQIHNGGFPTSTRSFVLENGTLSNTHYLSVPFNAAHKAGAMVTINFLLSPDAQLTKYDPAYWGEDMAIDPSTLNEQQRERLQRIDRGEATLPADVLATHRLPEIHSRYVQILEEEWLRHVVQN